MSLLPIIPPGLPSWMTVVLDPDGNIQVRSIDHTAYPNTAFETVAADCARRRIPMGATLIASMRSDPLIIARTLSSALALGLPRNLMRDLTGDELSLWEDPSHDLIGKGPGGARLTGPPTRTSTLSKADPF